MDLQTFKNKLFETAQNAGFEEYEIYCQNGFRTTINIFDQEVSQFTNASSAGVSFRGKFAGKMGYASSERIHEDIIPFLVDSAKANAQIIETAEIEELFPGSSVYPEVDTYNPDLNTLNSQQKIEKIMKVEAVAKAFDDRINAVPYCTMLDGEKEILIANSKGLDVSEKLNYIRAYAFCQASDGGNPKMGGDIYTKLDFEGFDPVAFGEKVAKNTLETLGATPVTSGKYKVVLDHHCAGDLLAAFFPSFSADQAHKGFSMLAGKLGENVASAVVTIIDDPLLPREIGSHSFDSEGVATRTKTVIEAGNFKTFLHNTKTARKDGVEPTGNGFKYDFNAPVTIGGTNFFIKPSDITQDELLAQVGDGLLITDFSGLHSGANPVSGEFSLQAEGFVIKDGKKDRPVELITVSGNFFTLLNQISAVANDLTLGLTEWNGNIASPSLLVESLDISGN